MVQVLLDMQYFTVQNYGFFICTYILLGTAPNLLLDTDYKNLTYLLACACKNVPTYLKLCCDKFPSPPPQKKEKIRCILLNVFQTLVYSSVSILLDRVSIELYTPWHRL